MQQGVYERQTNSVDELKQRLVEVWNSLTRPSTSGESNWACMRADGQYFEFEHCEHM